ncbi:HAMP domain-containing histidine kinase [Brevibacillus composti]|uniref:Heme sensor protein HssS n=1 Tax=Brevibacillus composti TaxID=2796470 RepID=A0A7T5ELD6_9BACL|nr:HAMP domain-containing sensor histidine kinase [Brevibacillus composti]QQE74738.1 HAMP domain-containing histidine kinase [Brevibacillus composti]QUO41822.1 HAMP domain-containing histidine kinase [Brevibacillus composti]
MKSLYVRLVATFIAILFVSGTLGFLLANAYYQKNLRAYNEQKIARISQEIISLYEQNESMDVREYLKRIANLNFQLYLMDASGEGMLFGAPFREQEIDQKIVDRVLKGDIYRGILEEEHSLFVTGFFENTLKNSIGMPLRAEGKTYALFVRPNIQQQFGEVHILFSLLLAATFLLSILFILVFTRYLVRPIKRLTKATKELAGGQYDIELDISRKDEIGVLAVNFAQMAQSLKQLEEMRQEFVSNVSHEIQSPLASIQGFSQAIRSGEVSEKQRENYLAIIEQESRRLSALSKQLLTLASLEKETSLYEPVRYRLDEQIRQVLLMLEPSWREKGLEIDLELPETTIYADKHLLNQVWINLIGNSIKFTEPGGSLFVGIRYDGDIVVTVKDTGVGISEEELKHIFERFYKGDKSRNRNSTGSGLGLSIAKKIVQVAGGSLQVESKLGEGTVFTVRLAKENRRLADRQGK